jgi:hypothetical protein
MYFKNNKICFIHIPRTSGTNFEHILGFHDHKVWRTPNYENLFGFDKNNKIMLQHATYSEILNINSTFLDNTIVTIVRHPYTRVHSLFKYFKKHEKIDDFLDFLENGRIQSYFYQPQYKFIYNNNSIINCDILKFEHFTEDFNAFKKKYNLDIKINFNEKLQKNKFEKITNSLTNQQKQRIKNLYKKDFELFNYD